MKRNLLLGFGLSALCLTGCSISILNPRKDPFYSVVLAKDSNQAFALYAQGQMLLDQGRFEDAEPFFKKLTRKDPQHAGGWLRLGKCSLELKKYRAADRAFQRAMDLYQSSEARFGLALAKLMQGDSQAAKKEADLLRSQLEDSPQLFNLYGDIAIVDGRSEEALGFYQQSAEIDPSQEVIQKRIRDLSSFLANR